MGLLSFLKRRRDPAAADPPPPDVPPDAVAVARTRARRRLIGASVLLAIGVVGFPLLFETQPRPIAVDIPIEMPNRDKAPPLVLTPAPGAVPTLTDPAPPPRLPPPELAERPGEAGQELPPPGATRPTEPPAAAARGGAGAASSPTAAAQTARPAPEARPIAEPRAAAEARPAAEPRPAAASKPPAAAPAAQAQVASKPATDKPATASEAARAQALLEGKPAPGAAAETAERMVVQVGAYTDPDKLRQVRAKLEAMGFKTYTQVVEVGGERRTRVRVGPFSNRAEADKAAARIKAAGLQAAILSL